MNNETVNNEQKEQLERAHFELAHKWHKGINLNFEGVDLGAVMVYDVLTVTGRILKKHLAANSANERE